jgi:hypothetical protein
VILYAHSLTPPTSCLSAVHHHKAFILTTSIGTVKFGQY